MKPIPITTLITYAESLEVASEDLDGDVHDLASSEAGDINNLGLAAQLRYILARVGGEATLEIIEEASE